MTQFTHNDVELGTRLYEALVHQAKVAGAAPIGYVDLLTLARSLHPRDAMLGRAVPIGIGMKLLFVETFCTRHGYPKLACVAVKDASGGPGPAYQGDWEADRRAVAGFDWATATAHLPAYADAIRATIPARMKPRKERPADVAWYAYFCSHRAACEKLTQEDKQEIINLLMAGLDPESALGRVLAARGVSGPAA
jgi:hypothetical protein